MQPPVCNFGFSLPKSNSNRDTAMKYQISTIPTVILFKNRQIAQPRQFAGMGIGKGFKAAIYAVMTKREQYSLSPLPTLSNSVYIQLINKIIIIGITLIPISARGFPIRRNNIQISLINNSIQIIIPVMGILYIDI